MIIEWAVATFGDRFAITSSMGDAVLAHLASKVAPGIDVVFLDTGYHFIETIGTRDAVEATLPVNLRTISAPQTGAPSRTRQYGKDLYKTDPDLCCALRKVKPLADALAEYDAWATGLRRAETHNRVIAPVVGWDARKGKVKVSPLARWSDEQVDTLHRRQRRPREPARPRRLPQHRLLALHPARRARRRPAQRPLGRHRQDRVRDPRMSTHPTRQRRRTPPSTNAPLRTIGGTADGCSCSGCPGPRKPGPSFGRDDQGPRRRGQGACAPTSGSRPPSSTSPSRRFDTVVDRLVKAGFDEIVVVPLLLTEAYHAKVDVPQRDRRRPWRATPDCGSRPRQILGMEAAFLEVLDVRLREALKAARVRELDALVLAAAGSSDAAGQPGRRAASPAPGVPVTSCPSPRPSRPPLRRPTGEAVRAFRAEGKRHIAVASFFLAPGMLPDRAAELALEAGAVAVSDPLGAHPEVARADPGPLRRGCGGARPGLTLQARCLLASRRDSPLSRSAWVRR